MGILKPSRAQECIGRKLLEDPSCSLSVMGSQGIGKTLAYLLPALKKMDTSKNVTQIICLVVSSEVAQQTVNVLARAAIYLKKSFQIGLVVQNNKGKVLTSNVNLHFIQHNTT